MDKMDNKGNRAKVTSRRQEFSLEFELSEEEKRAVIECIKQRGKISIKLEGGKVSKLPGKGLLDDTEGRLID